MGNQYYLIVENPLEQNDRINFGYVRDMIHVFPGWPNPLRGFFPDWQYVFPWIFNVADSLLCVGVTLMMVYTVFGAHEQG